MFKKIIFVLAAVLMCCGSTVAQNVLTIADLSAVAGEQIVLPVEMANTSAITGLSFELTLPAGVTVAKNDKGKFLVQNGQRADDQSISANYSDGVYYVATLSLSSSVYSGNAGPVCNITLDVAADAEIGEKTIALKNVVLGSPSNEKFRPADTSCKLTIAAPASDDDDTSDTDLSNFDDVIYIEAQSLTPGAEIEVPLLLRNAHEATGFSCTLELPEGLTIATDGEGYPDVTACAERFTNMNYVSCYGDFNADGDVDITCSISNTSRCKLTDNDGAVATLKVKAAADLKEGTYPIVLKNISIANQEGTSIAQVRVTFTYGNGWQCTHIQGDVNGDGKVTIEDLTCLVDILLKQ